MSYNMGNPHFEEFQAVLNEVQPAYKGIAEQVLEEVVDSRFLGKGRIREYFFTGGCGSCKDSACSVLIAYATAYGLLNDLGWNMLVVHRRNDDEPTWNRDQILFMADKLKGVVLKDKFSFTGIQPNIRINCESHNAMSSIYIKTIDGFDTEGYLAADLKALRNIKIVWFADVHKFTNMEYERVLECVCSHCETTPIVLNSGRMAEMSEWARRLPFVSWATGNYTTVPDAWLGEYFKWNAEDMRTLQFRDFLKEYLDRCDSIGRYERK